ncbi:hypothetical protein P7J64_05990, partial [Streptococcus suis]|uniref:hypothetical protein n=1 Tax=Streptococcus suis TaxID=1307 RepID=UPI0038B98233
KKAFLFCPDGVVSALKQPFFSKNSKKTNTKTMFVCNLKLLWSFLACCLEIRKQQSSIIGFVS